jgi:DNA-binding CsgD family transcriptional regulator
MSTTVGRERELNVVSDFVARNSSGVLAIVGEAGIGKTTVWREAIERAHAAGSRVALARPAEAEAKLSFAGLADLLADVPEEFFVGLPAPQRSGIDAALLRRHAARAPARRVVAAAFLSLLRALATDAPIVLAVDDVQWLDPPSAGILEFALRRLRDEAVCTVLSIRSQEVEKSALRLSHELRVEWLELGGLSVGALHRVLADTLGRTFSRPSLVRIAEASGGNPLYALEIARLLDRSEGAEISRLPVPKSLDALVRRRVRALPRSTRTALLRAAALARPDTAAVSADDLTAAEAAGLVRLTAAGRIQFVHPLFASAVYSTAAPAERRKTHRALAAVVSDPEERARHLALGCEGTDDRVVAELAAAARLAQQRGAPDSAAELTELALRLVRPGTDAAHDLQLELAERLFLASDFRRARAALEELEAVLPPGDLRARALLWLAEIDYWRSGESAALELSEEALAVAVEPVQRAHCLIKIAGNAATVDLRRAAAAARAAVELLDRLPDAPPALVAAALSVRIRAGLFLGDGFDAQGAERALELEAHAPPPLIDERVTFKLGQWLRYVDELGAARAHLVDAERQARDEGDESSLANILLNRVILETWAGDWELAAELADRMVEAFEQQGVVSGDVGLWRAYFHAHVGRWDAVQSAAERAAGEEPIIGAIWSRSLGLAALANGNVQAADRHLSDAVVRLDRIDMGEPAVFRVDGDAIEAAVTTGALERAEAWLRRFEERASRSRIPWSLAVSARCRGLLLAARGELDGAAEALERSLREHERCPVPFERARTLLVEGQVFRRMKKKRQARASLEQARTLFERLGSDAWVARADAELQRVAVRRAPDRLSATELRIAQLAAAGFSNPEIAAEVFVSRKTVEANLARAYRKLGVSSRGQLGPALERETEAIS